MFIAQLLNFRNIQMNLNRFQGKTFVLLLVLAAMAASCSNRKQAEGPQDPKLEKLKLLKDFQAEHLYSPSDNGNGSWVSMTFDDKGRMIASDQNGALYRLELPPIGADTTQKPKVEKLVMPALQDDANGDKVQMGYAHGLLYAFNSLYVMVNHRANEEFDKGSGLYRLQDTDGDDHFDKITLIRALNGQGEHGPHSLVIAPDSSSIFMTIGNHTDLPEMDEYRLPPVWKADNLFPQIKDPRGHANDRAAPGGWIAHIDSLGKHWELYSAGYRNPFDLAFNAAGDLFTYDSDMEWDFGMPWYRPTRICHVTSGSEFGWRTGNGKWRPYYPDNLPPVLNIGPGSPTNLIHARNAKFPAKYRQALFAFDWSFGIIYNIFLEPDGASYKAEKEEFLSGIPLPLTDGMIGPDGALYFLSGGRGLQSDLYRVYYTGKEDVTGELPALKLPEEHDLRVKLETYHREVGQEAVDFAWPYLKHPDRFVRYAARIAVEHQPLNLWQARTLNETDPDILIEATIALVHHGAPSLRDQLIRGLLKIDVDKLSESRQLDLMRAYELVFSRMGTPAGSVRSEVLASLDPRYPASSTVLNRELSKLLIVLEAPQVIERTLALMDKEEDGAASDEAMTGISDKIMRNPQYGLDLAGMLEKMPPAGQIYYATMLSRLNTGWTPETREKYFKWFYKGFGYQGGRSYVGFIDRARKLALEHVPAGKFDYYNALSGDSLLSSSGNEVIAVKGPEGPGKRWTMEAVAPFADSALAGRDFERGRRMYLAASCNRCHTMQGEGGTIGPDLTQLGTRFSQKDILEAIIDPSKVISDQYAATVLQLKDGKSIVGRVTNEDADSYSVSQNPFVPEAITRVPKSEVVSTNYSDVSIMLPGLINSMNKEELKDLLAYLVAGGDQDNAVFKGGESVLTAK